MDDLPTIDEIETAIRKVHQGNIGSHYLEVLVATAEWALPFLRGVQSIDANRREGGQ